MTAQRDAAGMAALSICESLLILLVEKGVLDIHEAQAALEDAAAAHQSHGIVDEDMDRLRKMAMHIVEQIMVQINAVETSAVSQGSRNNRVD